MVAHLVLVAKEAASGLNLRRSIDDRLLCIFGDFGTDGSLNEAFDETSEVSDIADQIVMFIVT